MAEFKKGQEVRVSYEATYEGPASYSGGNWHIVKVSAANEHGGFYADVPADATIEAIEEPFEEGAIYENWHGNRFVYFPQPGEPSWVFVGPISLGLVGRRYDTDAVGMKKLAPLAQ